LKARRRESVGLAIPASVVRSAIERAEEDLARTETRTPEIARVACETLLGALASGDEQLEHVERGLGGDFVAEAGFSGLIATHDDRASLLESFTADPTGALLTASAKRLIARALSAKGDPRTCAALPTQPAEANVAFTVRLSGHATTWVFGWEQARFKLLHDASIKPLTTLQVLEQLGAVQPPKRKWRPSLR